MDGITWKQARIAGLTKKQFDALDTFNYGAKDQKIDASLWQQVTSILEEAKENHSIKKTNGIRSELAKMLSIEQVAEKESETTYGFSWGGKKGNFFTYDSTCNAQNYLVQEGERAIAYLLEKGSLDGFELDKELIDAGYKVKIELETLYDDSSNDKAVAKMDDKGNYAVEVVEVSDGFELRIVYRKEDDEHIEVRGHISTDRSTAGAEERKKELGI